VMDQGHTYGTANGLRANIYCPPEFEVPNELTLTRDGAHVVLSLLSVASLECRDVIGVKGHCGSFDCHRAELGNCQCGRHGNDLDGNPVRVSYARANR